MSPEYKMSVFAKILMVLFSTFYHTYQKRKRTNHFTGNIHYTTDDCPRSSEDSLSLESEGQ